jgi:hypothetical protein
MEGSKVNDSNNLDIFQDAGLLRLAQLLENMDVPTMRKNLNKPSNIRWLLRNVAANNKGPEVPEVIALLIKEQARLK